MFDFKWWVFFDLRTLSYQNTIINADVIKLGKRLA